MKDNRKPGQSLLDYLWTNFGPYLVSSTIDNKDSIPTVELLENLVNNIKNTSLSSLKIVGNYLVGTTITGDTIFLLDTSEISNSGKTITNFGRRYINSTDVENGSAFPENTPVYYIRFSDGSELVSKIDQYTGYETNSVVVNIDQYRVLALIKIDNNDTIVPISVTLKGILANLSISPDTESVALTKELEGLKAKILLDNKGRTLKFKMMSETEYKLTDIDNTTIYLIPNKSYFYFGRYKIGSGSSTNLDDYYTKEEIDTKNSAMEKYIEESLAESVLTWKSI